MCTGYFGFCLPIHEIAVTHLANLKLEAVVGMCYGPTRVVNIRMSLRWCRWVNGTICLDWSNRSIWEIKIDFGCSGGRYGHQKTDIANP